jgi:catechol 2,3-dioxygenase-like lactoylglutathione lyase family enzyme
MQDSLCPRRSAGAADVSVSVELKMTILRFNHVQLAMPRGLEDQARRFYGDVLGLREIPKPGSLQARGGAWFDLGGAQLHLGVEAEFRPAKKAHVALDVDDLDALAVRCRAAGYEPRTDADIPGIRRFFVDDPFGNRLELVESRDSGPAGAPPVVV